MKTIEHKEIDLKIPTFLCDNPLNELNITEPFKFLTQGHKLNVIVGKSGSGKTSLLISMLTCKNIFKKCYDRILVFIPSHSRRSLKKNIFDKELPKEQLFEVLDFKNLSIAYEMVKLNSELNENTLLILDDVGTFIKDYNNARLLMDIVSNKRHYKCTIVILLQVYNTLTLQLRKSINNLILLYKPNWNEFQTTADELIEEKDKKLVKEIYDFCFEKPYDWLFLNTEQQKIFRKNLELVYKDID